MIYINLIVICKNHIVIPSFFLRKKMFFANKKEEMCEEIWKLLLRVVTLQVQSKNTQRTKLSFSEHDAMFFKAK